MTALVTLPNMNNSRSPHRNDHHQSRHDPTYSNALYIGPGSVTRRAIQEPVVAKSVHVYRNGDKFYGGKRFVLNRKKIPDMDQFLNMITTGIDCRTGAVRNIYTPSGGTRLNDLDEIEQRHTIVAGGKERFTNCNYLDIGKPKDKKAPRQHPNERHLPRRRINVEPAIYRNNPKTITIHVYPNGTYNKKIPVLLKPRQLKHFGNCLDEITEKISLRQRCDAIRKLYTFVDDDQIPVEATSFEDNHVYVACGSEMLKRGQKYCEFPSPPKTTRGLLQSRRLPPRRIPKTTQRTYANMHADKVHVDKTHVESKSNVRPKYHHKPVPPQSESETFPNKPVKHKRDTTKVNAPSTEADDNTRGAIYKAKQERIKAEVVHEDEDTHVDLPLDQIPAETVEEEEILDVTADHTEPEHQVDESVTEVPVAHSRTSHHSLDDEPRHSPALTPTSPSKHSAEENIFQESGNFENNEPIQPQTTFKANSMTVPPDYYNNDDDDKITFGEETSTKEIPSELPLLEENHQNEADNQEVDNKVLEKREEELIDTASKTEENKQLAIDEKRDKELENEPPVNEITFASVDPEKSVNLSHTDKEEELMPKENLEEETNKTENEENSNEAKLTEAHDDTNEGKTEDIMSKSATDQLDPIQAELNENNEQPISPKPVQSEHAEGEDDRGDLNELRKPDGMDETSEAAKINQSQEMQDDDHLEQETARPGTSTPPIAVGNGGIITTNEKESIPPTIAADKSSEQT